MTDIQNPTALSDYDFLELVAFLWKAENEGFSYAYEHYAPEFESPDMQQTAADRDGFEDFLQEHMTLVLAWGVLVANAVDLHNAHIDEARQRRLDGHLWGVRCTDGRIITASTEERRDYVVTSLLTDQLARTPAALLHRARPGGDWTDSPLPSQSA